MDSNPMHKVWWRQQQGVAMLLELVLLAAVLSLVGLALYMANNHTSNTGVNKTAATATEAADIAAEGVVQDAADEAVLAAEAEGAADEYSATEDDVTNLEESFDESNF